MTYVEYCHPRRLSIWSYYEVFVNKMHNYDNWESKDESQDEYKL